MSSFLTWCAVVAGGEAKEYSIAFAQTLILDSATDAAHDARTLMAKHSWVVADGNGSILDDNIL
jgi:hypothetical protein